MWLTLLCLELHDEWEDKEHVVEFDFLGKDSVRYWNFVPVEKRVSEIYFSFSFGIWGGFVCSIYKPIVLPRVRVTLSLSSGTGNGNRFTRVTRTLGTELPFKPSYLPVGIFLSCFWASTQNPNYQIRHLYLCASNESTLWELCTILLWHAYNLVHQWVACG